MENKRPRGLWGRFALLLKFVPGWGTIFSIGFSNLGIKQHYGIQFGWEEQTTVTACRLMTRSQQSLGLVGNQKYSEASKTFPGTAQPETIKLVHAEAIPCQGL